MCVYLRLIHLMNHIEICLESIQDPELHWCTLQVREMQRDVFLSWQRRRLRCSCGMSRYEVKLLRKTARKLFLSGIISSSDIVPD